MSVLALSAAPVSAQGASNGISGAWKFQSYPFEDNCVMAGIITFRTAARKDEFTCSFVTQSHCRSPSGFDRESWSVKQSCEATLSGKRLQVGSTVEKSEEHRIFGEPAPPELSGNYLPDNFDLLIEIPGAQMGGRIFDGVRRVPVRLWREEAQTS